MRVNGLDHINIQTVRLSQTARFYADVLGLKEGDPPANLDPCKVRWMFDGTERAIFHLSTPGSLLEEDETEPSNAASTGAVHHVALDCTGYASMAARLQPLTYFRIRNPFPVVRLS